MDWISVFISLAVYGVCGWLLGRFKERPLAGAVLGVLLGPIGWLILLLGPRGTTPCPYCGATLKLWQARCGACGASMTWIRGKPLGPRRSG
jgi:hypothetical protein